MELLKNIASIITAITTITVLVNKIFTKQLEPIKTSISKLDETQCKNYLVTFLKAIEKGEAMDEVEIKRAYEIYDHYEKDLHKNSYIHDKWIKLMK